MLKVDDHFKLWMRNRLKDRTYAERILCAFTEQEDAVLEDTWLHAAMPEGCAIDLDPEAMIGYLKGHVPSTGQNILAAVFGRWEDMEDLAMLYSGLLWSMFPVYTPWDEANLPVLFLVAFKDIEQDEEIAHIRWRDQDGNEATCFGFEKHKINIINTRLESDLIKMITGGKAADDNPEEGLDTGSEEQIKTELV